MKKLLIFIWVTFFKRIYHFLMPRFSVKKKIDGITYVLNLNDHISFIVGKYYEEPEVASVINKEWGTVWDVGSNFGLYSIMSAVAKNNVIAFDLSPLALEYLEKSAGINDVKVTIVPRAFTTKPMKFSPAKTSECFNKVTIQDDGEDSVTYKEAASSYGLPNLIKMDIEGGEQEFLTNDEFLNWLILNKISLLVELHNNYKPELSNYSSLNINQLDPSHILITVSE